MSTPPRCTGDRGTGLVGTLSGFLVFLVFLLFATQTLLGLFTRSTVSAAAYDGARFVAERGVLRSEQRAGAEAEGAARIRQLLGHAGRHARIDWTGSDDDWVVVSVRVPAPRLAWPGFSRPAGEIERSARSRVEALR